MLQLFTCVVFVSSWPGVDLKAADSNGERSQIIWRVTDWPPFYITLDTDARKGQGLFDKMISAYQAALPQFRHTTEEMSTDRALQQMKSRQPGLAVCHVSMLRSSLTGFALVSDLAVILHPHVIIARKSAAERILALSSRRDGFVSVEKLFLEPSLLGAHSDYGTHVALEKFKYLSAPLPNITIVAENYRNLADLFLNDRVDYVVQYYPFYTMLLESGGDVDSIVTIPIEETREQPYVEVYAGCTKNDIGEIAIAAINRVLAANPVEIQNARWRYYPPDQQIELRELYTRRAPRLNGN